jgi:hypothetical protein
VAGLIGNIDRASASASLVFVEGLLTFTSSFPVTLGLNSSADDLAVFAGRPATVLGSPPTSGRNSGRVLLRLR